MQASSLGLYSTLLKIHACNVFKSQDHATPPCVFPKRAEILRAPSRGKHDPRGQSQVFSYEFFGVTPFRAAAWPVPAGHGSDVKGRGSCGHEPQMNILAWMLLSKPLPSRDRQALQ